MKVVPSLSLALLLCISFARAVPGDPDLGYDPNVDDIMYCLALQPDGKLLIGGRFLNVGGQPRAHLARLNSDGALDASFTASADNGVEGVALQGDGKILICGTFATVNSVTRNRLARLNPDGSLDTSFNPSIGAGVNAVTEESDGKILLMGQFNNVNGAARQGFARLNANGSLDSGFTANLSWLVPNSANANGVMEQPDGKLILSGGTFRSVAGVDRWGCARVSATGAVDSVFNPHLEPETCSSISLLPDGRIILGGQFSSVGGTTRNRVARLSAAGTLDGSYNPGPNSIVAATCLQTDGAVVIGGQFTTVGGLARKAMARITTGGTLDNGFLPQLGIQVTCAAIQKDGRVIIGGNFQSVGGVTRHAMARIENGPATESLTAPTRSQVQWMRGGTSPELSRVNFELSTNGGTNWVLLGRGARIAGGWELTALSLPVGGLLRARGRSSDSKQNGIYETVLPFAFVPEIVVHSGLIGGPVIADGEATPVDFGVVRQAALPVPSRSFTVANTGMAPLVIGAISLPDGYFLAAPPALPVSVAENTTLSLTVTLGTAVAGIFAGNVILTNNDPDEGSFEFAVTGNVVTPEIAVHDGNIPAAPELSDGQTPPVDFGTTRQSTALVRDVTLANTGTAPLLVGGVTVPAGYTVLNLPQLPATIGINASLLLRIRLDAAAVGTFSGSIVIASDDLDEAVFDFPVTGTVVSPEIAVHDGNADAPELSDGQAAAVDFGRNVQGTPATRSFTIANTGTAALLVSSITMPPGYTALNVPALPLSIGINQSATFQISLTTLTVGTHTGSVVIASDDLDEAVFDFPLTGEIFIPDPVSGVVSTTTVLNRQTGLREQTIHITNDTTATVPAYNLIIRGLPAGVEVNNASETRADGSVVVYIRQTMQPHSTQDILLEYYSVTRSPVEINPQLSTEVVLNPPDLTVPGNDPGLTIDRITRLPGGAMMIEFTSVPGRRYQVQYSNDGATWQDSLPQIRAVSNRTQWTDRGLPRTDSHPATHASRIYRVLEIP